MAPKRITSREYKVLLSAVRFQGDRPTLLARAAEFWSDFSKAVSDVVVDTDGELREVDKERLVRYFDTPGQLLRENDYIFRERVGQAPGKREVALKFRHPDRYVVQDRDMDAAEKDNGKTKFEEDIKPGFQRVFSYSTKQRIDADQRLDRLDDLGRLFPGMPKKVKGYDGEVQIEVVGGFTAKEVVISGADFQIGKDPKVEAECSLGVWYNQDDDHQKPVIAEFSFTYGDKDEDYDGDVAWRACKAFDILEGEEMAHWVFKESTTKTAYVYDLARKA
ncbi:unnamed protein product [Ostreobium quekettii]|uniref:Uncharacterized protein n=1 Tax=Ostreobium quekettii TaxID=121088 RepID=A0A8S1IXB4_9CHLO|nr:unnamed protein product [Ostreobium quekettii]